MNEITYQKYAAFLMFSNDFTKEVMQKEPYNITDEEINELIKNEQIMVCENEVAILSIDPLYNYARKMTEENNHQKAEEMLRKCHFIVPSKYKVNLQLFWYSMVYKKYNEALYYFNFMKSSKNEKTINNNNTIIKLLNELVRLPFHLKEKASVMSERNCSIYNGRALIKGINIIDSEIVRLIFEKKYFEAFLTMNDLIVKAGKLDKEHSLIKLMLLNILEKDKKIILIASNRPKAQSGLTPKIYDIEMFETEDSIIFINKTTRLSKLSLNAELQNLKKNISEGNCEKVINNGENIISENFDKLDNNTLAGVFSRVGKAYLTLGKNIEAKSYFAFAERLFDDYQKTAFKKVSNE